MNSADGGLADSGWTPIIHKDGEAACGKVAFHWRGRLEGGMLFTAERVRLSDGTRPNPGEVLVCGGCGACVLVAVKEGRVICFSGNPPEDLLEGNEDGTVP